MSYEISRELKRLVWLAVAAVCIHLFYGWNLYLTYDQFFPIETFRLLSFGSYNNANSLSLLLTLTFPIAFSLMEIEVNTAKKAILLLFLALIVVSCAYTKSRGGNLGMMIAVVSSIYLSRSFIKSRPVKIGIIATVFALFGIYAVALILSRPDAFGYFGGGGESSSGDRLMAWKAAIRMFLDHPLFGVGWNNFIENAFNYGMDKKLIAHNTMLSVLAESGIVGFIFYIGILWTSIKPLLKIKKAYPKSKIDNLNIMNNGIMISFLCFLVDSTFSVKESEPAFWFLITLAAILSNIFRTHSREGASSRNRLILQSILKANDQYKLLKKFSLSEFSETEMAKKGF